MNFTGILALLIAFTASAFACKDSNYFLSAYIDGSYHPLAEIIVDGNYAFSTTFSSETPTLVVKDGSNLRLRYPLTDQSTFVGIDDDNYLSFDPNSEAVSFDNGPGRGKLRGTYYRTEIRELGQPKYVIKSDYPWYEFPAYSRVEIYVHNECNPGPNMWVYKD